MASRVIAIDGPAGSGKTSTALEVARRLGFTHLDSGALYRAATLAALDSGIAVTAQRVVALARSLPVRLGLTDAGFRPEVAGVDVSTEVRSDRVTKRVSEIAALPEVREWVNEELRAAARLGARGVVMDGRDIGSVVFPDAQVKVYLTATPEERARRRLLQLGRSDDPEAVRLAALEIARRDGLDSRREVAPLSVASDATVIDTTRLSFEEQVQAIVTRARAVFGSLDTVS